MNSIVSILYSVKSRYPWIYSLIDRFKAMFVRIAYARRIRLALDQALIAGRIDAQAVQIRGIGVEAAKTLHDFLATLPAAHLEYFHPHKFDLVSLRRVLDRLDILTYGLFVNDELKAYCLLKLFPGRKAYIGRLVGPELAGRGVGALLSRFLYWQCHLLGFRPYSTINEKNLASLRSHAKVRPYKVERALDEGYMLISFSITDADKVPPVLADGHIVWADGCGRQGSRAGSQVG